MPGTALGTGGEAAKQSSGRHGAYAVDGTTDPQHTDMIEEQRVLSVEKKIKEGKRKEDAYAQRCYFR